MGRQLIGTEEHRHQDQKHRGDRHRAAEKSTRMRDVRGRIFGGIGEAVERTRGLVDGGHQMRGYIHQVHRDPFGRQLARGGTIGTGKRLFIDETGFVLLGLPFRGRNAM